ncbi:MAG: DNA-deoxyinosine glycosylase [Clostridia bacterium]|nr:DNA-deoxyinosine glycosylase [Clostridia bacterium]
MRLHSFAPIIDHKCRILILGSIPGAESLRKQEYYGHPQNKFWDVIYGVFGKSPDYDYEDKKKFLLDQNIALWDVIKSCERTGSLDSKIKNAIVNDFQSLLSDHPRIKHIFFNGRTAEKLFKENFTFAGIKTTYLGSTSPAHAVPMERRLSEWSLVLQCLSIK